MSRPHRPSNQAGGPGITEAQRAAAMKALQSAALSCDIAAARVGECGLEEEAGHLRQLGLHMIAMFDRVRIEPGAPSVIDALYAALGSVRKEHRDALRELLREQMAG